MTEKSINNPFQSNQARTFFRWQAYLVKMKGNTSDSSAARAEREMEPEVLLIVENQIKMKSERRN